MESRTGDEWRGEVALLYVCGGEVGVGVGVRVGVFYIVNLCISLRQAASRAGKNAEK